MESVNDIIKKHLEDYKRRQEKIFETRKNQKETKQIVITIDLKGEIKI